MWGGLAGKGARRCGIIELSCILNMPLLTELGFFGGVLLQICRPAGAWGEWCLGWYISGLGPWGVLKDGLR